MAIEYKSKNIKLIQCFDLRKKNQFLTFLKIKV